MICRLGAPWRQNLPLIDHHGNFGSAEDPASAPRFVECRLSPAGQLAVEADLGRRPPVPVGLINGDLHRRMNDDWFEDGPPEIRFAPGFEPARLVTALIACCDGASDDDVLRRLGSPSIAETVLPADLEGLVATGRQRIAYRPHAEPCGARRVLVSAFGPAFHSQQVMKILERKLMRSPRVTRLVDASGRNEHGYRLRVELWLRSTEDVDPVVASIGRAEQLVSILRLDFGAPLADVLHRWVNRSGDSRTLAAGLEDFLAVVASGKDPRNPRI